MTAQTPSLPQPGELIGGRFRILEVLGTGGFGTVYRALQENVGRDVALKFLTPIVAKDPVAVERFRREAFHVSQLRHPNTITLYDYGQTDEGQVYMVMEFLQGISLAETVQSLGALAPARAAHIYIQVLKSLSEAHQRGLVHRDLKPENIFLCEMFGEQDYVKVLDFGVAKMTIADDSDAKQGEEQLTKAGRIFGTPMYMAPEQACAEPITPATDVYALGLLLFEILTGQPPVNGRNRMDVIHKQIRDLVPEMTSEMEHSPIGQLIRRACEKAPDARYTDASELLTGFRSALRRMQIVPASASTTRPDHLSVHVPGSSDVDEDNTVVQGTSDDPDVTRMEVIYADTVLDDSPSPLSEATRTSVDSLKLAEKIKSEGQLDDTTYVSTSSLISLPVPSSEPCYDLPLIGRSQELGALQSTITASIKTGSGHVILLEGASGLGKTRIIQELYTQLDHLALKIYASQFRRRGLPMEGLRDVLIHRLGLTNNNRTEFSSHARQALVQLNALSPSEVDCLVEFLTPNSHDESELRYNEAGTLHAHLEKLLLTLAKQSPLLIILEDVHYGDSATFAFLEYLSITLRTHPTPLFILLTLGVDERGQQSEFEQHLRALQANSGNGFTRIRLQPMRGRDLGLLLDAIIPLESRLKGRIAWLSQGIPLHALQIIRYLQSEDALIKKRTRWRLKKGTPRDIDLPPDLIELMHLRITQVVESHRERSHLEKTLQWLAILGMRPPIDLLKEVMHRAESISPADVDADLQSLLNDGIVRRTQHQNLLCVEFSSSLLREAILDALQHDSTTPWWHQIAAEHKVSFFRQRNVELPLIAIADHWRQAGLEEKYRDTLYAACQRSMKRFDLRGARNQYRELIQLLEARKQRDKMWINAHLALAELARRFGEFGLAEEYYRRILDSGAAQGRARSRALRGFAHLMTVQGRYREATSLYSKALDWSQQIRDSEGIAKALIGLSRVYMMLSDTQGGDKVRERLEQMVHTLPGHEVAGKILLHLAEAAQRRGQLQKRYDYLVRARQAFETIEDRQGLSDTLVALGGALMDSAMEDAPNRLQQAGRILRDALELKRSIGDRHGVAEAFRYLGQLEIELGDYDAADELLQQGLKIHEALGAPFNIGATHNALGIIQLLKCNYTRAEVHFDRAIDLFKSTGDQIAISQSLLNKGITAINFGRFQQAKVCLREAKAIKESHSTKLALFDLDNNLAIVAMWEGDFERAESLLNNTLQHVASDGTAEDRAMARSLMGLLQCFQSRLQVAALELGRAQADAEDIKMERLLAFCQANASFYACLTGSQATFETLVVPVKSTPVLHSLDRTIWLELLETMAMHVVKNTPDKQAVYLLRTAAIFWSLVAQNPTRARKVETKADKLDAALTSPHY